MKIKERHPPREFSVKDVHLKHMADIHLAENELVTFISSTNKEIDVTAKSWGYYLSGSTNSRLLDQGYITVVAQNPEGQKYILSYENEKMNEFEEYLAQQKMVIIANLAKVDVE